MAIGCDTESPMAHGFDKALPSQSRPMDFTVDHISGQAQWDAVTNALNGPVGGSGGADQISAKYIADLAKDAELAKTSNDPSRRIQDLQELQEALAAMRGDNRGLRSTLVEADTLLEGTGLKIVLGPNGDVWEGVKDRGDHQYRPKEMLLDHSYIPGPQPDKA